VQYMLLIYGNETEWSARTDDEVRTLMQGYGRLNDDLRAAGRLVRGDELQPVSTATSVRVRNDDTIVTDGPFAETKDVLGGFYLIEAETLDEAIDWASRIPDAQSGTIEVRPVVDHSGSSE
jgi:hypothetical protein